MKKYIQHISTECCYELKEDGKTIEICGCTMQPKIDGEIFWRYVDHYIEKKIIPADPFKRGD